MNSNHHKLNMLNTKKPYLNNSLAFANKMNKSRSLLKNSVMRVALKENNLQLAQSLGAKETEIIEMRKENLRLTRENYDVTHTGQFRAINTESFMTKFAQLSDIALSLFNNVCKLSDELMEIKDHPFVTGDYLAHESNNSDTVNRVPSPFAPKDKIPRSPTNSSEDLDVISGDTADILASKVSKIKNQSNHSIHNLSAIMDSNASFVHRPLNKTANLYHKASNLSQTIRDDVHTSSVASGTSKIKVLCQRTTEKKTSKDGEIIKKKMSKMKKYSQDADPMFSPIAPIKSNKRKRKPLSSNADVKESNKEEYKKHKEKDAYHLSMNETINTTILPPSLNEYKNQQGLVTQSEVIKEIVMVDLVKDPVKSQGNRKESVDVMEDMKQLNIVMETQQRPKKTKHNRNVKRARTNFIDDDDDFILPVERDTKKSTPNNVLGDRDDNADIEEQTENVVKEVTGKTLPKSKAPGRPKKKPKESEIVNDENILLDKPGDKKRRPIRANVRVGNIEEKALKSNISVIIDSVNADSDHYPVAIEDVVGQKRRKRN